MLGLLHLAHCQDLTPHTVKRSEGKGVEGKRRGGKGKEEEGKGRKKEGERGKRKGGLGWDGKRGEEEERRGGKEGEGEEKGSADWYMPRPMFNALAGP